MRLARFSFATAFGVLLSLAFFTSKSTAKPDTVTQILPGVWFREGDLTGHGHCNNIIVEMKDYLIMVDANFPSGAQRALADAKKVSSKPIKYVFDTHHHGDHAYANAFWTKQGATTLAYKGVAEEMKRYEPKRWQETSRERKDVAELNLTTAEPPKQTFDKTPYVIEDATRRVEFHFFGWAHTRGDGFVFLPKERLIATGDAVVNGPYNYTGDGNVGNWPNVVRKALKLNPKHVLPAHGEAGGQEILEGELRFMTELHKTVKDAIAKGRKLEDLVETKDGKPLKAKLELSAGVRHWVGDFFPAQVSDTYEEITQRKPHGEITGGK